MSGRAFFILSRYIILVFKPCEIMIRKMLASKSKEDKDRIKWRGHEVTRMEAFSDAVFAFAITLLIVALEVPETYEELIHCLRFFFPFAICFTIVFQIWLAQNRFFRRFGLHDERTNILNGILLFTVLFFMYPLKFLFSSMFSHEFKLEGLEQVQTLFYVYSGGFGLIYFLFTLMYHNAIRRSEILEMTTEEIFEAKTYMYRFAAISGIGFLSVFFAWTAMGKMIPAWAVYILIGPVVGMVHAKRGKTYKKHYPPAKAVVPVPVKDEEKAEQN
jgi:uncharacterized membrane protein